VHDSAHDIPAPVTEIPAANVYKYVKERGLDIPSLTTFYVFSPLFDTCFSLAKYVHVRADPGERPDQESRMNSKRPMNERTRLMLILQLAVILPAATLVILSARHLQKFQRDRAVEAAIERDFSQVLAISEKQINHKAYGLADDIRSEFPSPGDACSETFDRILSSHPEVAHLMAFNPESGFFFRSQPYRFKENAGFREESEYLSKMMEGWWKLEYDEFSKKLLKMQEKTTPYYFDGMWIQRGDKHVYTTTAIFPTTDKLTGGHAIAGVTFDGDYLR